MNNPIKATRYTWQSVILTDSQHYCITILIATAACPAGTGTQNTDECAVLARASVPVPPWLTAQVF